MNALDAVVGGVLAVGIVRGYVTGFFRQAGSVIGFVLGFTLAATLMSPAGAFFHRYGYFSAEFAPLVGFLSVFLIVYLVAMVTVRVAEDTFAAAKLTGLNRAAGALAGGLKAALLVSVVLVALAYAGEPSQDARRTSTLYGPVSMLAPRAWSWVSDNADTFTELTRRLEVEIERRTPQ